MTSRAAITILAGLLGGAAVLRSQTPIDKPVLYVTGTAHLDSQWNWTVQDTIRQYVPSTFYTNFKNFERYPDYTFSYEGAIHYMWFKEYHPDDWGTLQRYVANGRWRLAGSWINAVDTNIPSPESLMRQALYGQRFFRQEFGKVSRDVYLPDCFGFGFALPSIAVHSGLRAFTTQKLTWGSSVPIPFPIGRWRGPDGSEVIANLNPGDYVTKITSDIGTDPKWSNDLTPLGGNAKVGFRLFGTGDIGGGPNQASLTWLEKSLATTGGAVEVRNTSPDQLSADLTAAQKAALPVYEGELTMQTHGVGCYTSQAAMKKFNRQNELLADAAERAGVAATTVAGLPYESDRLRSAWTRVLWHQFHDDLTGTCIPQAYQFSWNDELSASNQFAGVLTSAVSAIAGQLDTSGPGVPVVVYNPVAAERTSLVEATVDFPAAPPPTIQVTGTGLRTTAQILSTSGRQARILFPATMSSVGYAVFHAGPGASGASGAPVARVTARPAELAIENSRYVVRLDQNGDISSIRDKTAQQELLAAPIRLELRDDPSPDKPAWRILYSTEMSPVREYPSPPISPIRLVENGPWRATLEVVRQAAGSTIVQRISLASGGNRVEVETVADWQSPNTLLKASFPFAASNPRATYDLGLGTIARGNDTEKAYEVPAQQWVDLTDSTGGFGAAVMSDSKYGWDKPADNILRLSLLHTPLPRAYPYQSSNDLGHHRFAYAVEGHAGDWRTGRVPAIAEDFNQPLIAFQTDAHTGRLGDHYSLLGVTAADGQVAVRALKRAEDSDEIVVRLQERYGRAGRATLQFPGAVTTLRELNAAEEAMGAESRPAREVSVALTPYETKTVAVRLGLAATRSPIASAPVALPFNLDGVSTDAAPLDGDFDGRGHSVAGELWPARLELDGVRFQFGPSDAGALNVFVPSGQTLTLPPGPHQRLEIIAAAVEGDASMTVTLGRATETRLVREWEGAIGQWDSRLIATSALREPFVPASPNGTPSTAEVGAGMVIPWDPRTFTVNPTDIDRIRRGFATRDELAWIGTHRHDRSGNQPYVMSYLFLYSIELPAGQSAVTIEPNPRLRIVAASVLSGPPRARSLAPLYSPDLPDRPSVPPGRGGGSRH